MQHLRQGASLRRDSDIPSSPLRGTGTVEYVFQSAVNKNVPAVYWVSLAHPHSTKTLRLTILWTIVEALQRERESSDTVMSCMSTSWDGIDVSGLRFSLFDIFDFLFCLRIGFSCVAPQL